MRDKVILEDQSGKAISPETEITQVKDSNNAPLFVEESGVISVTQGHSIHGDSLADGTINYDKISGAVIPNPELIGDEDELGSLQFGDTKYKIVGGGGGGSGMDITAQEIANYFEVCDVAASVTTEGNDVVLNLTNADIVTENEEPVLTTEVPNVSVQNNILEIE